MTAEPTAEPTRGPDGGKVTLLNNVMAVRRLARRDDVV